MFSYSMSKAGSDTLYHYLYKCIKEDVLQGKIQADEKLPSKRSLAKNLGVSVITVENAYAQLLAEGFIYSLPKKGFFVWSIRKSETPRRTAHSRESMTESSNGNIGSASGRVKPPKYFADFVSNQADLDSFPFSVWARIARQVLCERQGDLLKNPPSAGVLDLRRAIARMLREFRNIQVEPEQIVIGAGTDYLYGLLVQLLGFDKKYGVEDPGYSKISKIYNKFNVDCYYIPVGLDGRFMKALRQENPDVMHISPAHHFPTGIVMPVNTRYELLAWAAESDRRYIVEDDYDCEFRMTGLPIPSLQNIDVQEKVVYINTFSKTLTSTVRVSYMVLPKHLAKKFHEEFSFYSCTVSNLEQYALAKFMEGGFYEKHINRMRNYYRGKRDLLLKTIARSPLAKFVEIAEEDAGLHFILNVRTNLSDEEFCRRAREKGVNLNALSDYYFEAEPSEHRFVINYSSVEDARMAKAIRVLSDIVSEK